MALAGLLQFICGPGGRAGKLMAEPSLLEALGSPNLEVLPPPSASAEWTARRDCLRAHLAAAGCHAHIRTPAAGVEGRPGRRW